MFKETLEYLITSYDQSITFSRDKMPLKIYMGKKGIKISATKNQHVHTVPLSILS